MSAVPSVLLRQGARRVPLVAAAALVMHLVSWVIPLTARGDFLEEFTRVWDWVPPVTAILVSILLIAVTKAFPVPSQVTVKLGLL